MKGISELVAIILILSISVSLVSMAAIWLSENQEKLQRGIELSQEKQIFRSGACLSIKEYTSNLENITIENCGKFTLSKFEVYINGNKTETISKPDKIEPGYSGVIQINPVGPGNYTLKITSDYAASIMAIEIK